MNFWWIGDVITETYAYFAWLDQALDEYISLRTDNVENLIEIILIFAQICDIGS